MVLPRNGAVIAPGHFAESPTLNDPAMAVSVNYRVEIKKFALRLFTPNISFEFRRNFTSLLTIQHFRNTAWHLGADCPLGIEHRLVYNEQDTR
jgi:hypothetical protein